MSNSERAGGGGPERAEGGATVSVNIGCGMGRWCGPFFLSLFLAMLGRYCFAWAFSSCRAWATLHCHAWASHCSGFSCCGAQAPGRRASVIAAHGLSSCNSRALEYKFSSCGAWA